MPSRQMNYNPRRRRGVPVGLVVALLISALAIGGVLGYFFYTRAGRDDANTVNVFSSFPPAEDTDAESPDASEDADDISGDFVDQDEAVGLLSGDDAAAPLNDAFEGLSESAEDELLSVPEEPVVVAEFEGGQVMSTEVVDAYNELVSAYVLAGFSVADYADELLEDVLYEEVSSRVAYIKAEELKLTELTDEDEAAIAEQANAIFEETIAGHAGHVGEGETAATREEIIAHLEEEENLTLESLETLIREEWWSEKLYAHVTADVELTDEALQQAYDDLAESQKSDFEEYPEDYEYARMNGEMIAYNPAGYRAVKHIFFALDDASFERCVALTDELAGLNAESDAERIAEIGAELDAIYAPLEEKAQAALGRIAAGETFDAVMAELGEDEMMQVEPVSESGYYICKDSLLWSEDFVAAAMALEAPGDLSEPVRSESGVHVISYAAEVAAGNVPLAELREALAEETLALLQQDAYNEQLDLWLEEAGAVYYPERLQ